jgi:hypothetical protein
MGAYSTQVVCGVSTRLLTEHELRGIVLKRSRDADIIEHVYHLPLHLVCLLLVCLDRHQQCVVNVPPTTTNAVPIREAHYVLDLGFHCILLCYLCVLRAIHCCLLPSSTVLIYQSLLFHATISISTYIHIYTVVLMCDLLVCD